MPAPNVIVLSPVPTGPLSNVGSFYPVASEFPADPWTTWITWVNYPWMTPGGVNRINLPNNDPKLT